MQLARKAADFMGPRSDFDILRILSHQLASHKLGNPIRLRTPEAAFEEIRGHVFGYDVSRANLLLGRAEPALREAPASANGTDLGELPPGVVWSSNDSLFTSGSLTPYCRMVQTLREAEEKS